VISGARAQSSAALVDQQGMSSGLASSPRAYRQSAVLTATPGQLVVLLYDGVHRFLKQAAIATRSGDIAISHNKLRRAEMIISHLRETLDMEQGEVAERLRAIYNHCTRQLGEARFNRDADAIEQVDKLLGELREAWAQAART